MKGIHTAFEGTLGRDAEVRTTASGKTFMKLAIAVGEDDAREWIDVAVWSETLIELAPSLVKGVALYCEGRLSLRRWTATDGPRVTPSVSASLVQPLALIGKSKPKTPRANAKKGARVDSQAPIEGVQHEVPFNDEMPF